MARKEFRRPADDPADGDDRLHRLISGQADGTLSDAEFPELSARLAADPQARAVWFLRNDIEIGLARVTAPAAAATPTPALASAAGWATAAGRSSARRGRQVAVTLVATAGLLAVVALIGPAAWRATGDRDAGPQSPAASPPSAGGPAPLATVTEARFVLFGNDAAAPRLGEPVEAGRVRLAAGMLQFTIRNGVVITLQGPAALDLIDQERAFLSEGAAVVKVPKGMSGFRLDTATTEVLDLGTEFAVRVGNGVATDVQVYDGAVIANRTGGGFPTRLEAGEAARFDPAADRDPRPIPFVEGRFIRNTSVSPPIEDQRYRDDADYALRVYGRPRFDSIRVRPAPAHVTIDGRLAEWPAPGFASMLPDREEATHGVQGRMMYDDEHLYIAAHVADPAALRNRYDPDLDAHIAWQGGGLQVRFSADRRMGWPVDANSPEYYLARRISPDASEREKSQNQKLSHLTLWHHAATGRACIAINRGTRFADPLVNPIGVRGAFTAAADGRGYTLEYAIPWRILNAADDPPRAGDVLGTVWQVFWADESGLLWRDQMVEVRNLDEPPRMSPHERAACWGRAEFE
jgi:ferric-dicitrate binding protein FerR (iron transport regulator)